MTEQNYCISFLSNAKKVPSILHFAFCILHLSACILPLHNPYLRHSHHVIPTIHIRQGLDDALAVTEFVLEG